MSLENKMSKRTQRRKHRVRSRFASRGKVLRATVQRSLAHISVQIIDDIKQGTVVSYSSLRDKSLKGSGVDVARAVGQAAAKMAMEKGVDRVFFDRGAYLYHGRVKALAEGLRDGGLSL